MSGFEPNRIYSVAVHEPPAASAPDSPAETEKLLVEFIQAFRLGEEYIYR
jgi:DNA replication licensing factor MCM5